MVKVENRKTLWLLTRRFMKTNRGRNRIAILSIMLTSLLFTSLFAGSVSMILTKRSADVKECMDSSHAGIQNQTEKEARKTAAGIAKDREVAKAGTGIFLGPGIDKRMKFSAEVRSGDKNLAESFNCLPVKGEMPQKENEIAMSTVVLDALGVDHKVGAEVTLVYENNPNEKEHKTDTFILSGFWTGDKTVMSQLIWVSDTYAQKNRYPVTRKEIDEGIYNGSIDTVVWYKNLWNLRGKTEKLSKSLPSAGGRTQLEVNPAYDLLEEDSFSFVSLAVMILFILLAGYLIIYNIFNISVKTDIQTYGLLKNVGTTGKQLKKIVRMQAFSLSVVGIPIGLILGYFLTILMAPVISSDMDITTQVNQTRDTVVSANPLIFLGAALFALFTVYLSSMQACHMVEKVSPVEAMQLAVSGHSTKKIKKNTSVSWMGMAFQNMRSSWRKGIIVMISVALSLIVVDSIVMLVKGYDFNECKEAYIASDFELSQMTGNLDTSNFNGVSWNERKIIDRCPDCLSTGYIYHSVYSHKMEKNLRKIWKKIGRPGNTDLWSKPEKQYWKQAMDSGKVNVHFMGITRSVFEKLDWAGKPCTWKEFADGNHVIINYNFIYASKPTPFYKKGESLNMIFENGKSKKYRAAGAADLPFSLSYPFWDMTGLMVLVPDTEYRKETQNTSAMYASIDAKKGKETQIQKYLDEKILKQNDSMGEASVQAVRENFERYVRQYYVIGGMLVIVLSVISIMNFFNTTETSILSRRKELALLEVVGMTKSQIKKMLIAEGCIYIVGAFIIAVGIVYTCAAKVIGNTLGCAFFFHIHLTVVPCILMIPVLLIIAFIIPIYQYEKMEKESLVDRIRME